jgi:hypothetical protein
MMAFQSRLRGLTGHPGRHTPREAALRLHLTIFLGGLYGGYFNAALGVLLIAGLALVLDESIQRIGWSRPSPDRRADPGDGLSCRKRPAQG